MRQDDRSSIARGFLFADLRGYSAFVERYGDRAGVELLTTYRDIVRRVVPRFSGAEIRTEGDSFYVVFNSPSAALRCGLAILDETRRTTTARGDSINVGIGVHAGETMELDDAYVGSAVNIAARICSVAEAGQLLTTEAVRSLTHSYLDVTFVAVGRRRLKGITDPIFVYRVVTEAEAIAPRRLAAWLRSPLRAGASIAVVVAVVGTSLVIATLMREGFAAVSPAATSTASAADGASASASGRREAAGDVATPAPVGPFPTSAEQRLLALVEEQFQPSCERAPEEQRPTYTVHGTLVQPQEATRVRVSAEVVCSPFGGEAPDELLLWTVSTPAVPAYELILNIAATHEAAFRPCEGELPAHEAWSVGPLGGRRVCLDDPAVIYWTYDGADVLGRVTRSDGDMQALLAWWEAEARLRRPS